MNKTVIICTAILCVFLFTDCGNKKKPDANERRLTIGKVDLRDVLTQTGEVRTVVKVDIKSEASGRIDTVYVRSGQRVKRGDTLIVIDPSRLLFKKERVELALQKAKIESDIAKRDYENAGELIQTGTVSERKLIDYESRWNLADISYRQQLLDLKDINDELAKTVVTSPMDGVITSLNVEEGEIAVSATTGFSGGTAIATIADISRLEVVSQIGPADYKLLRIGQRVNIRPEAVENAYTTGQITFIALSAKKQNSDDLGSFEVRISIDSVIAGITAGINVNVEFVMTEKKGVLGVPYIAVNNRDHKRTVMKVVNKDGKEMIVPAPVEVGATDFRHYEIVSGLKEGDVVVIAEEKSQAGPPAAGGGRGRP